MNIRLRLFLAFAIIMSLGMSMYAYFSIKNLRPRYLAITEDILVDTSVILSALLSQGIKDNQIHIDTFDSVIQEAKRRSFQATIYEKTKTKLELGIYITDAQGKIIYNTWDDSLTGKDYSMWNDVFLTLKGRYGARSTQFDPKQEGSDMFVSAPIKQGQKIYGVLSVGYRTSQVIEFVREAKKRIILGAIYFVLGSLILAYLLGWWLTRPIMLLTRYVRDIRDGKKPPYPHIAHSEVNVLGQALEEMRIALEGKNYVEMYAQNLTHEIKSPLTGIMTATEILQESHNQQNKFLNNIEHGAKRIQSIIDRLLNLIKLEKRDQLEKNELIALDRLFEDILHGFSITQENKGITIELEGNNNHMVYGDPLLLRLAIENIIQNAFEFMPSQGKLKIIFSKNNAHVQIQFCDNGIGIPDYALDKVLNRFYSLPRPKTNKKSTGLGLNLVKEVIHLHKGSVWFKNNTDKGCSVFIKLPCPK